MSDRRHEVLRARRDLRARGCDCHSTVTLYPAAVVRSAGATAGAFVRHQPGCTLGDRVAILNRAGYVPAVIDDGRCHR